MGFKLGPQFAANIIADAKVCQYNFEVYKDKKGEYRFRFIAPNGKTMADSGEGYKSKQACFDAIDSIKEHVVNANIKESL